MSGDPCAREDVNETTPHNIPDRPAVCEVTAMIGVQRAGVKGWNGARVDRGSLNQVVDEEEKQHGDGQVKGAQLSRCHLSESLSTRWRGAEYTQNTRVAQWPTYCRATNNE